eukprot:997757-Rhodomonas_salina.1
MQSRLCQHPACPLAGADEERGLLRRAGTCRSSVGQTWAGVPRLAASAPPAPGAARVGLDTCHVTCYSFAETGASFEFRGIRPVIGRKTIEGCTA